jgi:hypothetical protein
MMALPYRYVVSIFPERRKLDDMNTVALVWDGNVTSLSGPTPRRATGLLVVPTPCICHCYGAVGLIFRGVARVPIQAAQQARMGWALAAGSFTAIFFQGVPEDSSTASQCRTAAQWGAFDR